MWRLLSKRESVYALAMTVEAIRNAIEELSEPEFSQLGSWFDELREQACDRQAASGQKSDGAVGAPTFDPYFEAAVGRTRKAVDDLVVRGLTDQAGNRIRTDLPEDMKEGADRDFGG